MAHLWLAQFDNLVSPRRDTISRESYRKVSILPYIRYSSTLLPSNICEIYYQVFNAQVSVNLQGCPTGILITIPAFPTNSKTAFHGLSSKTFCMQV